MYGGGYDDLSNFGKRRFSHKRTWNVDTRSYSASFLHLNRLFESLSFCAECSDVFYKGEFNAKNSLPAIDGVPSEVSDCFAQFWKMLSETSDGFAQFGKVPSEVSDTPA